MSTTTVPETRKAIRVYLLHDLDGQATHLGRDHWQLLPVGQDRGPIRLELELGRAYTMVSIDRWHGRNLPDDQAPWLDAHVTPFVERALARHRGWSLIPTPGSFSSGRVLTAELLDLLRVWLPFELDWQQRLALEPEPLP